MKSPSGRNFSTLKESYFPKSYRSDNAGTYIDDEQGGTAQDVDTTDTMKRYMSFYQS